MKDDNIRRMVRENYARIAAQESSCCGAGTPCGCDNSQDSMSKTIGYTAEQLGTIPDGANLGLGCGNPAALASLKEGEVVLDLGSGAGIDCFLAANAVGGSGHVIGVDMTVEMIDRARQNAREHDYQNVEFRLGEIENLPLADNVVDVVISNCVINLSPNKPRVFEETYRVLKPGGRVMISDIVLTKTLPAAIKDSIEAYVSCVAGAITKQEYLATIQAAGFQGIEVVSEVTAKGVLDGPTARSIAEKTGTTLEISEEAVASIASIAVQAMKPTDPKQSRRES
ncbi:arsenite methyltransferase [Candidatus Bipolaricaulota bacterium]|nr:arsenite methyltransferase [Candidatus Bipolaricaulota bacterium]